jgi:hypothetical protein
MFDLRRLLRAKVLLPILILAPFATGCEDPSNVGLGLIGESGGEPVRITIAASDLPPDVSPPVTSNVRGSAGFTVGPSTTLAGTVADPLFGTIETKAYLDVALPSTASTTFRTGTITSVSLIIVPNYVYGDTMATTSLIVSEMDAAWPDANLTADTTLTPGPEIARFDFVYRDTTLVIGLPQEWYSLRSSVLLSSNIATEFHGFELSTSGPSAVVGFSGTSAIFRIATTTGTADLVVSKIFTHVRRHDDANIPAGRAVIQDGIGESAALSFEFDEDSLRGAAVSRAVVELFVDQETMDEVPANFVRPIPPQFDFVGVREDGTSRVLRSTVIGDGVIRFVSTTAAPGEFTILRTVQQAATGNPEFDEYHVRITEAQAAINSILVFDPDAGESTPRAILTVTVSSF